ncbi:recombinase family protein [Desulfomonile tiedjei]|nr:recombinase family protein [Desulfomonile tiedjei]
MRAIGYARVSSREQIDGTSLESQETMIRQYAALKGMELVDVLVDAGVSGGKPLASRPEGARLAEMVGSGEVQAVIICKLDRGFRSASDCLNNVEAWEKDSVSLHILNLGGQSIDTSTPTGKFFITIMAGAAELERNMINERCNEGRKARKAEGKRIGELPYGYDLADDGKLVENETEQRALTIIRDMKNAGSSLRTIANHLNEHGYTPKKSPVWTHGHVQSVLRRAA